MMLRRATTPLDMILSATLVPPPLPSPAMLPVSSRLSSTWPLRTPSSARLSGLLKLSALALESHGSTSTLLLHPTTVLTCRLTSPSVPPYPTLTSDMPSRRSGATSSSTTAPLAPQQMLRPVIRTPLLPLTETTFAGLGTRSSTLSS